MWHSVLDFIYRKNSAVGANFSKAILFPKALEKDRLIAYDWIKYPGALITSDDMHVIQTEADGYSEGRNAKFPGDRHPGYGKCGGRHNHEHILIRF